MGEGQHVSRESNIITDQLFEATIYLITILTCYWESDTSVWTFNLLKTCQSCQGKWAELDAWCLSLLYYSPVSSDMHRDPSEGAKKANILWSLLYKCHITWKKCVSKQEIRLLAPNKIWKSCSCSSYQGLDRLEASRRCGFIDCILSLAFPSVVTHEHSASSFYILQVPACPPGCVSTLDIFCSQALYLRFLIIVTYQTSR